LLVVQGFLDLLRRSKGDLLDDEGRACVDAGLRGTERMHQLIEDLLVYSRAGRAPETTAPVDLGAVLDDAVDGLAVQIEAANASVTRGELPVVEGDEAQLGQVFQNLLANALKFCRPGVAPAVSITAEADGGTWRIAVTDNGIGIPADKHDDVLAMFTRLHDQQSFPGSGIGLAICQRILQAHGGSISVGDAPEGTGTRVVVTLPG
jgi:signal transduction histidine kinase